ncbi:hypothetical protein Hanom_Chr12g01171751 [Helianthus anomalus]
MSMFFLVLAILDVGSEVLLHKVNRRLGILVHLYLHSLERILVLAASSVGKRHRMVSNTGFGSLSKDIRSALYILLVFIFSCSFCWIDTTK